MYHSIINSIKFYQKELKNRNESEKDSIEWLIIDDGSVEDIKKVIDGFEKISSLEITYIKQKNGGKHTAYNKAIDVCNGELFVCIDDDDRLTINAISDIFNLAKLYRKDKCYQECGGIVGRALDEKGNKLGTSLHLYPLISNTIDIRDKYHFWGEPEIHFVDKLKLFRFKVFKEERFLTEAYLFDEMSKKYPFIYTDISMIRKVYLEGGLTDKNLQIRIESPRGAEEYYYRRSKLCEGFRHKLKAVVNRQRFSYWIKKQKPVRSLDVYEILAKPISKFVYLNDKRQYRILNRRG